MNRTFIKRKKIERGFHSVTKSKLKKTKRKEKRKKGRTIRWILPIIQNEWRERLSRWGHARRSEWNERIRWSTQLVEPVASANERANDNIIVDPPVALSIARFKESPHLEQRRCYLARRVLPIRRGATATRAAKKQGRLKPLRNTIG